MSFIDLISGITIFEFKGADAWCLLDGVLIFVF